MITINDFINDKSALEIYYTPFSEKLAIVDTIINEYKSDNVDLNTAQLYNIADVVFIQTITNLNIVEKNDDGLNGYDTLCKLNLFSFLIEIIKSEYDIFKQILNYRIGDIYGRII